MITKIRSFQDSFWVKGILILTALSFMSLFGISGYLGRANANRPIIKVDDTVIYRDEINAQLNQQLQTAKALLGDGAELSDEMKNAMMLDIVHKNVINAIIQKLPMTTASASVTNWFAKLFICNLNLPMQTAVSTLKKCAVC